MNDFTAKTKKATGFAEGYGIEHFEVIFVDHINRKAKNMILTVAPYGNWFENKEQQFSFEGNVSILDGKGKNIFQVPFGGSVDVETPIGTIRLNQNKAELI